MEQNGIGSEMNIHLQYFVIAVALRCYHAYYLCFVLLYSMRVLLFLSSQCTFFEPQMTVGCMYGHLVH